MDAFLGNHYYFFAWLTVHFVLWVVVLENKQPWYLWLVVPMVVGAILFKPLAPMFEPDYMSLIKVVPDATAITALEARNLKAFFCVQTVCSLVALIASTATGKKTIRRTR